MTLLLALSCDGHHRREMCREQWVVGPVDTGSLEDAVATATAAATIAGWRRLPGPLGERHHLCPDRRHDEEPP